MAQLPSGMVTFMFTDIEGSTKVFRRLGDGYPALVERHNELLRAAFRSHSGVEIKTEGDAFFVAFCSARDAIRASVEAQHVLETEPWPDDGRIRVRMGLHTGVAAPRDNDYIAYAVHQAARVVGAAHGGQVIVSPATREAAGEPDGIGFLGLGRFRVRDFDEPIELFQVTARGLATEFPASRAVPAEGHNVVRRQNAFVGRAVDLEGVGELVGPGRLVTVVGPGGIGKTRLVEEIALRHARDWGAGVWFVALAAIRDGSLVEDSIARSLGVSVADHISVDTIAGHVGRDPLLLLLDNCEQILADVGKVMAQLLERCPNLGAIATSRSPLGIGAEMVWRLGALDDPTELFVERARSADARFDPTADERSTIVEICRRIDGLPLAIELAAARVGKMTLREILAGLDDQNRLLRSRSPDLDERQRSMRALLDWSLCLLDDVERVVFRRLAVFSDSFSLEAAESACGWGEIDTYDVAETVWSLVDRSLLQPNSVEHETRYAMLETVRVYARDLLIDEGEQVETAGRVAGWLLETCGPRDWRNRRWIRDAQVEVNNIRGVISIISGDAQAEAQQLACTIALLHDANQTTLQGIAEARQHVELLTEPTPHRLGLLSYLSYMFRALVQDVPPDILDAAHRMVALGFSEPDWCQGRLGTTEAFALMRSGATAEALALAESAIASDLRPVERSRWHNLLAIHLAGHNGLDRAVELLEENLEIATRADDPLSLSVALGNLAETRLRLGDVQSAARHQLDALEVASQFGQKTLIAHTLIVAARLSGDQRVWDTAFLLQTIADGFLTEQGTSLYEDDRALCDALLAGARLELDADELSELTRRATSYDTVAAADLARRTLEGVVQGTRPSAPPNPEANPDVG